MIATRDRIPVYRLYGEDTPADTPAVQEPEFFHLESIPSRSRLHDMHIQPHRHANMFQLLYITRGTAGIEFDDRQFPIGPQTLLTVPPRIVHGFRFSADIDGWVISLTDDHVCAILDPVPRLQSWLDRPLAVKIDEAGGTAGRVDFLISQLVTEYQSHHPGRLFALRNILGLLLLDVSRHAHLHREGRLSRQEQKMAKFRKFQTLIEGAYRDHLSLARYARDIGITTTQLNRICKDVYGMTASEVIQARLILEAKRTLIYTDVSIQEIATELGFQDAGYFSRLFAKKTGLSPARFRADHR